MKKNLSNKFRNTLSLDEEARHGFQNRKRECCRLLKELRLYMLHELCWADQEDDLIQKLLYLMMDINSMLRQALRERAMHPESAAEIFITPKKLSMSLKE